VHNVAAVAFALLAAVSNALATALQRRAARTVPLSTGLRLRLIVELIHRPVWLAGLGAVLAAACFQALALSFGALTLVQPLFVLELPFALLIGGVVLGRRVTRAAWAAVSWIVVGLGVALAAAAPAGGVAQPPMDRWGMALVSCAGMVAVLVVIAARRPRGAMRAACLGAAAAVGYALTAALLKSATHVWQSAGTGGFFLAWQTYGFALVGVGSIFLLENAMQSGPLVASQPALTLGDALVSMSLGLALYSEHIRSGWWVLPEVAGAGAVLCGAVLLARMPLAQALVGPAEAPLPSDAAGP
jgi:hypothetical protein